MASETDVVIVDADSVGVSAAKEFTRLSLKYTLIEGSHRISARADVFREGCPGRWLAASDWLAG